MKNPHAVSVIIVNWNSGPWLARVFAGLREQTHADFELIVVDNASQDDSLARALPILPQALLLRQTENLGFAAGNNLAAAVATGHWLAFLNPDAIPAPTWLERLLAATRRYPQFVIFGSRQVMAEQPERLDGLGDAYHVSGLPWRMGYGASTWAAPDQAAEIFSPCAAAALYRRDLFLDCGGFDVRFFCYLEDVDLGFRCRLLGQRALSVPDAVVHHAGSVTTGRFSDFTIFHSQRNLLWVFLKNMPWALLLAYLPLHVLLNVFFLLRFSLRGQGRVVWRAKWQALRGLAAVLAARRALQARRVVGVRPLLACLARGWPRRQALPRPLNTE